jgi:hypothetical protein
MGEVQDYLFEPEFNRAIKVQGTDHRLTSNAGVVLLREADHRLGLLASIAQNITDPRREDRTRYTITELLRERVYAMAIGYEAQDDLDRLAHDPAFRAAVWDRPGQEVINERLASQPTQSRLIRILTGSSQNLNAVRDGLAESVERHLKASTGVSRVRHGTIDLDSFPIEIHGSQKGGAHNGHYKKKIYHPLVASFSVAGDYDSTRQGNRLGNGFLHATLRQGQVHTADGARRFIANVAEKARKIAQHIDFRIDAGYTIGSVMDDMTNHSLRFVGRLKGNPRLDRLAAEHVYRPAGRPPAGGYEYTVELGSYQADSWEHSQRLILVVVDKPDPRTGQLNLMPRYFFLVTNWRENQRTAEELLAHYRPRGTFEDRLGEFNAAIGPHLSSQSFKANEATMLLSLLSFNLSSICRIELEDEVGGCWDLTRFQLFVLKVSGEIIKHSRRAILRIAESAEPLWSRLIGRIKAWRLPESFVQPTAKRRKWTPPPSHAHLSEVLRY